MTTDKTGRTSAGMDGGSIGTPLDNAVGYGCRLVARLLLQRGARAEGLWQAAALGLTARVEERLTAIPAPSRDDLNHAFSQACHGGQRRTAGYLLAHGADIDASPGHSDRTPLEIAGSLDTRRQPLTDWLPSQGAQSSRDESQT